MFTCPLCQTKSFGYWQVALTPPSRALRCTSCQGEVGVHQPSRVHALLLAMMASGVVGRTRGHALWDAAIVLGLLAALGWLLWRGLYLTRLTTPLGGPGSPATPDTPTT